MAGVRNNDTAEPLEVSQDVEYGVTKERSDPLRQSTGISVTSDGIVSAGLAAEKISMGLNRQLTGLDPPPPLEEFTSRSVTEKVTVPAMTAVVLFIRMIYYRTARSDNSLRIAVITSAKVRFLPIEVKHPCCVLFSEHRSLSHETLQDSRDLFTHGRTALRHIDAVL